MMATYSAIKEQESKAMPALSLPPPILSLTPGTWAYDTMSRRVDEEILQRTYEENKEEFHSPGFEEAFVRFEELRRSLRESSKLTHLNDLTADEQNNAERAKEYKEWQEILTPFIDSGDTWLSAPWMVTEFYVYRRLMQALGYWDSSNPVTHKYDPFAKQKKAGLVSSVTMAESALGKIPTLPNTDEGMEVAAAFALWGNKMDLSLWPADGGSDNHHVFDKILASARDNLLHDDTAKLTAHCDNLRDAGGGNVDIIVDNAGFELVMDLALAQYLVDSGIAKVVTFQLKSHPTFVSDALEKDLLETVDHYVSLDPVKHPNAQAAGLKWKSFLEAGKWACHEDNFWVQPYAMWDMTEPLRTDMKERCNLAFVKGDANYRRLLGDREWDLTAPFQEVVGNYFPCPVTALRTLKAELGVGMDADKVKYAKEADENWMVNGRFGVVQFGTGATE